ncbi:uncharacterized protein Bfra_004922ia [Botrytis fragariae]|uniref:Uncharacterized protein n=1 Tax=Botrytis fragariae TaxID=1964551 RepID=A0A8H6ATG0_9HELO|nr:uncharacterized protein Bfra_004922ia [Botrytis fragariae]KAF5873461.1 hypothetical protein Bfra_004922ia [Botrytis fragariae]
MRVRESLPTICGKAPSAYPTANSTPNPLVVTQAVENSPTLCKVCVIPIHLKTSILGRQSRHDIQAPGDSAHPGRLKPCQILPLTRMSPYRQRNRTSRVRSRYETATRS